MNFSIQFDGSTEVSNLRQLLFDANVMDQFDISLSGHATGEGLFKLLLMQHKTTIVMD